jgi:hypothetical protein
MSRARLGDDPLDRTLHYVAGGLYFATGEAIQLSATR